MDAAAASLEHLVLPAAGRAGSFALAARAPAAVAARGGVAGGGEEGEGEREEEEEREGEREGERRRW